MTYKDTDLCMSNVSIKGDHTMTTKKAVFLDRDGVINPCPPFVNKPEDFSLLPQVKETLQRLKDAGFAIHVVTNQGGIGLGFMTLNDMKAMNLHMMSMLPMIDSVEYCPHKPDEGCDCRKPKGKLILDVIKMRGYDVSRCWMLGDQWSDVEAGYDAGLMHSKCVQVKSNTNSLQLMSGLILWRDRNMSKLIKDAKRKTDVEAGVKKPKRASKLTDQERKDRKNARNRAYRAKKKLRDEEAKKETQPEN